MAEEVEMGPVAVRVTEPVELLTVMLEPAVSWVTPMLEIVPVELSSTPVPAEKPRFVRAVEVLFRSLKLFVTFKNVELERVAISPSPKLVRKVEVETISEPLLAVCRKAEMF